MPRSITTKPSARSRKRRLDALKSSQEKSSSIRKTSGCHQFHHAVGFHDHVLALRQNLFDHPRRARQFTRRHAQPEASAPRPPPGTARCPYRPPRIPRQRANSSPSIRLAPARRSPPCDCAHTPLPYCVIFSAVQCTVAHLADQPRHYTRLADIPRMPAHHHQHQLFLSNSASRRFSSASSLRISGRRARLASCSRCCFSGRAGVPHTVSPAAHDLRRQHAAARPQHRARFDPRLVADPHLPADHRVILHHHAARKSGLRRHHHVLARCGSCGRRAPCCRAWCLRRSR